MRQRQPLLALVALLGFGLIAAAYAIWSLEAQVRANQNLVRQQQKTVAALLARDAENTQELQDQRRLVQGLQAQVLKLGGTPLLTAPAVPSPRPSQPSTSDGPATSRPSAAPRPTSTRSPTPQPSPTQYPPNPTPTPAPSPSQSCTVKVGPVCL